MVYTKGDVEVTMTLVLFGRIAQRRIPFGVCRLQSASVS